MNFTKKHHKNPCLQGVKVDKVTYCECRSIYDIMTLSEFNF